VSSLLPFDLRRILAGWDWRQSWLFLAGPIAVALVYLDARMGWRVLTVKAYPEWFAIALLPVALAIGLWRGRFREPRNPLMLWLAGLALVFWCREIHFRGTDVGVYVGLAVLAGLAWIYRNRLLPRLVEGKTRYWLAAACFAYVLSQVIARRAFRDVLPMERKLHAPYEEAVETAAHLLLFGTTLTGHLFGRRAAAVEVEPKFEEGDTEVSV
jgi:hypothetical protein